MKKWVDNACPERARDGLLAHLMDVVIEPALETDPVPTFDEIKELCRMLIQNEGSHNAIWYSRYKDDRLFKRLDSAVRGELLLERVPYSKPVYDAAEAFLCDGGQKTCPKRAWGSFRPWCRPRRKGHL